MGKSTVLRYVDQEFGQKEVWKSTGVLVVSVYIDGLSLPRPLTPQIVWALILRAIHQAVRNERIDITEAEYNDFVREAQHLVGQSEFAVRVVVLFDEIEHVLINEWATAFFANWRALLSNTPPLSSAFSVVFSGAQELAALQHDIGSPLMDVLEWRALRNLSYPDACRLMQEPLGKKLPPRVLKLIFDETGGQPMLIQYLMQRLEKGKTSRAYESARAASHEFLIKRSWQFKVWWEKHCTPVAQRVYGRLPQTMRYLPLRELTTEFGTRDANDALEILQHIGVVAGDGDSLRFRRAGRMFSRWQTTNSVLTPSRLHDPVVFEKLRKIDNGLASKYASAWAIAATQLPNYSGSVGEMRDTITLVLHHLAPDDKVSAEPGYRPEQGQRRPTRRQRAHFAGKKRMLSVEQTSALLGDIELIDAMASQLAQSVTTLYDQASGLTHTTATSERAYQALRQGDSVLLQLLA